MYVHNPSFALVMHHYTLLLHRLPQITSYQIVASEIVYKQCFAHDKCFGNQPHGYLSIVNSSIRQSIILLVKEEFDFGTPQNYTHQKASQLVYLH